ncbi:MAG: tetratricopeptide repeat protein [Sphingomicrobium sp.]
MSLILLPLGGAQAVDYEPLDPRHWGGVLAAPDPKHYTVQETLAYRSGTTLFPFTLYRPMAKSKAPVVVIVNGVGDASDDRVMDWAIYKSWGALFAANGIAAVTMTANSATLDQNLADLVDHLNAKGESLGVDPTRIALFSASANTNLAGRYLQSAKGRANVDSAIFYYGSAPSGDFPRDIPVLFVVAEGDLRSPFGASYNDLWARVMQSKAPWTVIFGASQPHAFDALDPTPESRRIMASSIDFLRRALYPLKGSEFAHADERAVLRAMYNNDSPVTIDTLKAYLQKNPESARARAELGRRLTDAGRFDEAEPVLAKALEADPASGALNIASSRMMMARNQPEAAYQAAKAAVDGGFANVAAVGQLGLAAMAAGHVDEAIAAFRRAAQAPVARGSSFYNLACALAVKGDKEAAMDALEQAATNGYRDAAAMGADPDLASLRGDARFEALKTRLASAPAS